jgi:prepilin-type N-terminal cleavage/methylation domain-containing protein
MNPCRKKDGFTLVELLVVIAIIGVLTGLLLPAVQAARESARRTSCRQNMKQISLALLNYESARGIFPAAVTGDRNVMPCNSDVEAKRQNWVVSILPFIEQQSVYNKFDLSESPADAANESARSTRIQTFLCPSDTLNGTPFNGSAGGDSVAYGDNWARGNYGANSSLWFLGNDGNNGVDNGSSPENWANPIRRGVMGFNTAVKVGQVTDGTSKTAMLLELRAGLTEYDGRGVWALGMPGASSLWAHGGIYHDANGPNSSFWAADDVPNCFDLRDRFGTEELGAMEMGCYPGGTEYWQGAASRSMHKGGVFISCVDGSVHWIRNEISVMPSTATALSVWDRLMLSADGQMIKVED